MGAATSLETAGEPTQLKLTAIQNPEGTKADGADMILYQVEVLDAQGHRCPLDDRMIHFELWGEAQWIGGIGTRSMNLPVVCGINRVLVRTTPHAGDIHLAASAEGLKPAYITLRSEMVDAARYQPALTLQGRLDRGETPSAPSYTEKARGITIVSAQAGYDTEHAAKSLRRQRACRSGRMTADSLRPGSLIRLAEKTTIDDICMKLTGWRLRSYPLEIYAGKQLIWSGETPRSLGYVHLKPQKACEDQ